MIRKTPGDPKVRHVRRIIRFPEVRDRTGLSKTTIWRRTRDGTFPKQVSMSQGVVGWAEDEVDNWIADCIAGRDGRRSGPPKTAA